MVGELDNTIVDGQLGHLDTHDKLATLYNGLLKADGTPFTAAELSGAGAVSTDTGTSQQVYVGEMPPVAAQEGDAWFDTFAYTVDWANGWPPVTELVVNASANTYARTTPNAVDDFRGGNQARPVGRIAAASGTGGSDRRVYLFDDVPLLDDIEVLALIYGRGPLITSAQQGLALRVTNVGDSANQNMFAAWNDAALGGLPSWWNVAKWKGFGPADLSGGVGGFVEGLERPLYVASGSRTSNVVTLVLGAPHEVRVGDIVNVVLADTSYNSGNFTVTSVTGQTITYAQTAADDASSGSGLLSYLHPRCFPHWVRARCVGAMFEVKVWRATEGEPSWQNPRYVRRAATVTGAPTGLGRVGIIGAHQSFDNSEFTDWGPITVTRASRGWKVLRGAVWVPTERSL